MRRIAGLFGYVIGSYLVLRAAIEPWTIDMTDPSTYRNDWGGPSLAGVLLVHMGPGALAAILMGMAVRRRWRFAARNEKGSAAKSIATPETMEE